MVFLYYKIFKAIHNRAKMNIGSKKPASSSDTGHSMLVIENKAETNKLNESCRSGDSNSLKRAEWRHLKQKVVSSSIQLPQIVEIEGISNCGVGSGGDEEEDEEHDTTDGDHGSSGESKVIKNMETNEDVIDGSYCVKKDNNLLEIDKHKRLNDGLQGFEVNLDSGYVASNVEETQFCVINPMADSRNSSRPDSPVNGVSPSDQEAAVIPNKRKLMEKSDSTVSNPVYCSKVSLDKDTTVERNNNKSPKKKSRFMFGRKPKSRQKRREKASARRERKATKTLAIVLGELVD